jgi:hypothetical protein
MIFANGEYREIMDGATLTKVKAVITPASTLHELRREILPVH